ncbi:MAG: WHG domain-containing protein, partial [Actinomycetota bacterium]
GAGRGLDRVERARPMTAATARTALDRERVLDVAADLADRDGLAELTLAKLAGELGIRSQSLYAHIDGIEGLRDGLARRAHELLGDQLRNAAMARTGADALRAVVRALAAFAASRPGLYAASLRAAGSPDLEEVSDRTVAPLTAVLASFGLEGDDLVHHYRVIWSSVHGFVTLRQAGMLTWEADPDDSFDLMVEMFVVELEQRGRS